MGSVFLRTLKIKEEFNERRNSCFMFTLFLVLVYNLVFLPVYGLVHSVNSVNNRNYAGFITQPVVNGIHGIICNLTTFILILTIFYQIEFFGHQAEENDGTTEDKSDLFGDLLKFKSDNDTESQPRGSIMQSPIGLTTKRQYHINNASSATRKSNKSQINASQADCQQLLEF